MADLAQGYHANIVLQAHEALFVEVDGTATVQMLWGGPSGTTPLSNQSQVFGPYGVPARLRLACQTGNAGYRVGEDDSADEGTVFVAGSAAPSTVKIKLETLNPVQVTGSPAGRGRPVKMPARELYCPVGVGLSQMQSIQGAGVGSSIVRVDATGLAAGSYGLLNVLDDSVSLRGIRGQGAIRDVNFDGNRQAMAADRVVSGYLAAARAGSARAHTFRNAEFANFSGHGVDIRDGNDQFCSERLRAEGNAGRGVSLVGSSDGKHRGMGCMGNEQEAIYVERCGTPVIDGFDAGNPNAGLKSEFTVLLVDQARATFRSGTISGRLGIKGRNDQGTGVRYDMAGNIFDALSIKVDEYLAAMYTANAGLYTYDSHIYLEDVDDTIFVNLKAMFNDVSPSAEAIAKRPLYLFKHGSTTGGGTAPVRRGHTRLVGTSGLIHKRARTADGTALVAFSRHYADDPTKVEFEGFTPGVPEIVPAYMVDSVDPDVRSHVEFGSTIQKAIYPFGYLFATLGTGGTLDDASTQVVLPTAASIGLPALSTAFKYAFRVQP